ncbi:hypothetical protein [Deinococcus irradiatisoli]|uniref:hypothetical protein n=1 Tax=Deinococcus irradiatisoli TaxID=2202254 RepID=UPI0015E855FE|nr:hypothetical protein [Deinococcus irradiatisoli]
MTASPSHSDSSSPVPGAGGVVLSGRLETGESAETAVCEVGEETGVRAQAPADNLWSVR